MNKKNVLVLIIVYVVISVGLYFLLVGVEEWAKNVADCIRNACA